MTNVTLDEMLGFISLKVFCAEDAHRNLALRVLARDMVLQANLYTTELCRKAAKHTKYFGPAGGLATTTCNGGFASCGCRLRHTWHYGQSPTKHGRPYRQAFS